MNTSVFRIQQLEKDLYYYKKTSRDLKKKLREVMLRLGEQAAPGFSADVHIEESGIEPLDYEPHNRNSPRLSPTGTHLPPLGKKVYKLNINLCKISSLNILCDKPTLWIIISEIIRYLMFRNSVAKHI